MFSERTKVVIMAAGKGTRMKSAYAKVMHEVFFAPMLHHVLAALEPLSLTKETVVVTGHQAEVVEASLSAFPVSFARQVEQLGTAHAVLAARKFFAGFGGTILILCGDTPLIRPETLRGMLFEHRSVGATLTVMTTRMIDPSNYGRIVTSSAGEILRIVEEKDATAEEKSINEINAGVYCVEAGFLREGLAAVDDKNCQCEFYLTDLIAIAGSRNLRVGGYFCHDSLEVLGVNSRLELAEAHRELQSRRNRGLMLEGVSIIGPESVEISPGVQIDRDTVIFRNVRISGKTTVGGSCRIGPQAVLHNCRIGEGVVIEPGVFLMDCEVAAGVTVAAGTVCRSSVLQSNLF
ncbi:MAG: bifunctional N-acetylglucosamine-1-phosphate uridyltransferase/glucosamine-1-phosphate acetyltransferase [Desulfobulbaceae bacterium]|nr:bifunctional N-acetylglucosamine-1-phosphate uridyltransferase/glucosamine-1-phosphate acetyltransferase [Desulfobulbaceae bacterium]